MLKFMKFLSINLIFLICLSFSSVYARTSISISSVSFSIHVDEHGIADNSLVDVRVNYSTNSDQQLTIILASENIPSISLETMSKIIYMNQIQNDGSGVYNFTVSKEKIESALDGEIADGCTLYVQIGGSDIDNFAVKSATFNQGYVSASVPGDADGDGRLTVLDALAICRKLAGHSVDINVTVCDVDGRPGVTVLDALTICRKLAGHNVELV